MEEIAISKFKATCLAVLEKVKENRPTHPRHSLRPSNRATTPPAPAKHGRKRLVQAWVP